MRPSAPGKVYNLKLEIYVSVLTLILNDANGTYHGENGAVKFQ
jgi:hypothetical protein